jgi:hypothetical protein
LKNHGKNGGENVRKYEKELLKAEIDNETAVLKQLEQIYKEALNQIRDRIKILTLPDGMYEPSKIYQKQYQEQLKRQVETILKKLQENQYATIEEYLKDCYYSGIVGTMYSLQKQGVPLLMPINQESAVKAITLESKLSEDLYRTLGVDTAKLSQTVRSEISRGIVTAAPYSQIARNIENVAKPGIANAKRIVRTEGHRIQQAARYQAQQRAKAVGADVVKEWDSVLDGKTRPTHRKLHGQIREIDEPFEMDGKKAMYPGEFNDPAEDCNCRCDSHTRSRIALNLKEDETVWLGRTEKMTDQQLQPIADKLHIPVSELRKYGNQIIPVKAKNYEDFKRQYNKIWNYESSDLKIRVDARRAGKK